MAPTDATVIHRRCPHCGAIRHAEVVSLGDPVPFGAEIVTVEHARADKWAHDVGCPERKPMQGHMLTPSRGTHDEAR